MNSDDDWTPRDEFESGIRLKWGLNGETGDLALWEVAGPGDGFPVHSEYLLARWGRPPHFDRGDLVGSVNGDGTNLSVLAYGAAVPDALLALLRERFPGAKLVT